MSGERRTKEAVQKRMLRCIQVFLGAAYGGALLPRPPSRCNVGHVSRLNDRAALALFLCPVCLSVAEWRLARSGGGAQLHCCSTAFLRGVRG